MTEEFHEDGTRSGSACFTITGASFTKLVRARMLDGNPGAAYRLASSLISDDATQSVSDVALQLCDGDVKLVDVPGSYDKALKPCHAKTYKRKVAWLYAGRIRIREKWYRPVAYVSNMDLMDLRNDHSKPTHQYTMGGIPNRAWHYCGKDDIVVEHAHYVDKEHMDREVIFEQCGERPHWHDVPMSPQDALDCRAVDLPSLRPRHQHPHRRDRGLPLSSVRRSPDRLVVELQVVAAEPDGVRHHHQQKEATMTEFETAEDAKKFLMGISHPLLDEFRKTVDKQPFSNLIGWFTNPRALMALLQDKNVGDDDFKVICAAGMLAIADELDKRFPVSRLVSL